VVTSGLLEVLGTEEANAVLAHEIGHMEHLDFLVMTLAALAPLLLYQIYVFTRPASTIFAPWHTQRISAIAESIYRFDAEPHPRILGRSLCAEVTRDPDALSSALCENRLRHGEDEGEYREAMANGSKDQKAEGRRIPSRRAAWL